MKTYPLAASVVVSGGMPVSESHRAAGLAYLRIEHELIHVAAVPNLSERLTAATLGQAFTDQSAVTFVWAVIPYRMEWRYGMASHKVIALDAGHVWLWLPEWGWKGGRRLFQVAYRNICSLDAESQRDGDLTHT